MLRTVFIELAEAYMASYKRECDICNSLSNYKIYVDKEEDPLNHSVEKVLDKLLPMREGAPGALLTLADDGVIYFYETDSGEEEKEIAIHTPAELYDYIGGSLDGSTIL